MKEPDARHLDRDGLKQYLSAGAHAVLKLEGAPALYLIIEPAVQTLRLRVPQAKNKLPDVSVYRNFAADLVHWSGAQWCQLSVSGAIIVDAYPVLIAIADRIQKSGVEFGAATRSTLEAFREVLAAGTALSDEAAVGLLGELLVLRHFLSAMPAQAAVDTWRGHEPEEHDFGLPDLDLEVKTTTNEARLHWISSLTQLLPTVGRPLYLASVQLTSSGVGGVTLSDMVARTEAATPASLRDALANKLSAAGWRNEDISTYVRRFRLRTKLKVYAVLGEFPTLTPEKLASVNASGAIVQLRYAIDLSNVAAAPSAPAPLATLPEEASL